MKNWKLLDINNFGHNSLRGTIFDRYGIEALQNVNNHNWIIIVHPSDIDNAAGEAISLGIQNYIVTSKVGMIAVIDGKTR
jgi:hypothetical protein